MRWIEHKSWKPIETAPRDGSRIELLIPYNREKFSEAECTDQGYWDSEVETERSRPHYQKGCFRFDGDDGAFDLQPTHWRNIGK